MTTNATLAAVQIVGFGLFLWLGFYLFLQATERTPLINVSLIGLFAQSLFFLFSALTDAITDVQWLIVTERWSWWTVVVPAATWFHFSSLIAAQLPRYRQRQEQRIFTPLSIAVYVIAGIMGIAGGTTDAFVSFTDLAHMTNSTGAPISIQPGFAYSFHILYLVLTTSGALINFMVALRACVRSQGADDRVLIQQLRLLIGGAFLFLGGALWLVAEYNWNLGISSLPGFLCLLAGLALVGYGVAHFGLLLGGQNSQRDFLYSFTSIGLLNLLYIGLLSATVQLSVVSLLMLVALVTVTHTTFDSGRRLLDRLFFSRDEQIARSEARDFAVALASAPVALAAIGYVEQPHEAAETADELEGVSSEKEFKYLVRRALTGLKSPPQLVKSPLLGLALVERRLAQTSMQDNRLNRVAVLRELLIEQIEGLRPATPLGQQHMSSDAWRFYNVLHIPYVRGLSRKSALMEARRMEQERRRQGQAAPSELEQVFRWLADIDEDTFYKWQRRGSDTIAAVLWEEDMKCQAQPNVGLDQAQVYVS